MAARFGGFDMNSLADNGFDDRMVDDLGKKNVIGKSGDGFRILEKANVFVGETNEIGESLISESKSSFGEMIVCDDDFMLDMVGKVLDRKFGCVDKEKGVGNDSQSGSAVNLVVDLNSTSEKGICIRNAIDEGMVLRGGQDLRANELMPGGDSETKKGIEKETDVLMSERYGERVIFEEYDEYHVSDLVWGKVRGHPWWPGQIFASSAASNKALEYMTDDSYLIAYFGDGTFAWNEESKIKPFLRNFSKMENQCNTEEVRHAVSCALDEVSRRVEVGLSCACLPQEVRSKIETQVVVNAGIRKKSSKRVGGGRFFAAAHTFFADEIVDFVNFVATHPSREIGTLSVAEKKAELTAFNRWKGRYHLTSLVEFGELVDDEKGERSDYEVVNEVHSKNRKSRACPSLDENLTYKKKRRISTLMSSTKFSEIAQRSGAAISKNSINVHEILSMLRLAAINSLQFGAIMGSAADFILECRSSVYGKGKNMEQSSSSMETTEEFVSQSFSQPGEHGNETTEDYKPTSLILQFDNLESIPPVTDLNEIFRRFGSLIESETKISSKSMRAQVIFEKRADADAAYSSPGKYSTFGPSLVKYALNHAHTFHKAGGTSKHNKNSPT